MYNLDPLLHKPSPEHSQNVLLEERCQIPFYRQVLEVLKEEGQLECLGKEAQRRRAQDHQELVDRLLEDRRARRAAAVARQQQETQAAIQYHQIR